MIHKTAIVSPKAKIASDVEIGAYCIIEDDVEISQGTKIHNHVSIHGPTIIGENNTFYPHSVIGHDPQDKKYENEKSFLYIGDHNTIREYVTINRGTKASADTSHNGFGETRVGSHCWIMASSHIAHDCIVQDNVIIANGTTLGGHVLIEQSAVLGGYTLVHQFCSIGAFCISGGGSVITQDIAPFSQVVGNRSRLVGINKVGLDRNNDFSEEEIKIICHIFKYFFRSSLSKNEALDTIEKEFGTFPWAQHFIKFVNNSTRGICR